MVRLFLLLLLIIVSGCTPVTSMRAHRDYLKQLSESKRFAIFTPSVEVVSVGFDGKKTRQYNYEPLVEDTIVEILQTKLKRMGYKTQFFLRRQIHDKKLSPHILKFQEASDEVIEQLYKKPYLELEKAHDIKFSVSPSEEIAKAFESDLVILIKYYLETKTSVALASEFAIKIFLSLVGARSDNQSPNESLYLKIIIFNPYNGELVWSNSSENFYGVLNGTPKKIEIQRLNKIFNEMFKDFPGLKK